MITSILFDLDGTLIDSNLWHDLAFRQTLLETNPEVLKKFMYDSIKGMSTEEAFALLMPHTDKCIINNCIRYKQDFYFKLLNDGKVQIYKGAIELLKFLKDINIKIFLVTGSSKRSVNLILDTYNLKFDGIICSSDFNESKPNPEPYLICLSRYCINISEAIVIEDSESGIVSGLDAGLKTFGVHNSSIKNLCTLWFPDLVELTSYFKTNLPVL